MFSAILGDPDLTRKLLDAVIDSPNGRRSVSRLARTCKAMCEPALNILWRELDSFLPLIGLFPNSLLKRARRPGLGLTKAPSPEDWDRLLEYGKRVRRITYVETSSISPSIFAIINDHSPVSYILPHLEQLTWKVETAAGLERSILFLNPELQSLVLEVGNRIPRLDTYLSNVCSLTQLTAFSFTSPTTLPDSFTDILRSQDTLEKLVLVAPGALSAQVGQWSASLRTLRSLELDLTGRSAIAVEGFFDDIIPSGASTPSDTGTSALSSDELDFAQIRKSSLQLTGDLHSGRVFTDLRHLSLTGEVSNIAVFLKHITGYLTSLDLVIEDPPDLADWQDLSFIICERFDQSLRTLRITATGSSRFSELVRATSRGGDPPSRHLPLQSFTSLPYLLRFEIDLPESISFHNEDLECIAKACPNIEMLRLCPMARFSGSSGPTLTLEGLTTLTKNCRRLHTLALVLDARTGTEETLNSIEMSSRSLLRLFVGHSLIHDPLRTSILLSHLAPHLETLKWFHEKNRPGYVEANAQGWQRVSDWLPYLQGVRLMERRRVAAIESEVEARRPRMREQAVDATDKRTYVNKFAHVRPKTSECAVQSSTPSLVDRMVQVKPDLLSVFVDATPKCVDVEVDAAPAMKHQSVAVTSKGVDVEIDATPPVTEKKLEDRPYELPGVFPSNAKYDIYAIPSVLPAVLTGLLAFACRIIMTVPLAIPKHMLDKSLSVLHADKANGDEPSHEKHELQHSPSCSISTATELLDHDIPPGYFHEYYLNADWSGKQTTDHESECASNTGKTPPSEQGHSWKGKREHERQTEPNIFARTRQSTTSKPDKPYSRLHYNQAMAESRKQERDFSPEVDALVPQVTTLAKSGKLTEGLDKLFALEKQTRNASDPSSTTRLAKTALSICYEVHNYVQLNATIGSLSKKHGQLKVVIQAMVEQAIGWLSELKEREGDAMWLELVETLRTITEGKIFLETPRARVTLLLSHYHETLGNKLSVSPASKQESLQTASDLLSDLQVETYSSMERREKTEFILEQMRLLIALARLKDAEVAGKRGEDGKPGLGGGEPEWVKAKVGGRKVNETFLKEKENEDLKIKFYDLMIQQALHQSAYLEVAKHYEKVWDTPSIMEDESQNRAALEHIVYYVVLAPHDNEQSDMLHHLFNNPALEKLELHFNLVKSFVTRELMRWPGIETIYGPFLRRTPVFSVAKRWEDLHTRVIEHNIRVVAQYYSRITLSRLTTLLDLTPQQTEETLARLVVSKTIWARIDRPAGIVNFRSKRTAEDLMNDWSSDMQRLLGLVEKTWMGMNAALAAQSRVRA